MEATFPFLRALILTLILTHFLPLALYILIDLPEMPRTFSLNVALIVDLALSSSRSGANFLMNGAVASTLYWRVALVASGLPAPS